MERGERANHGTLERRRVFARWADRIRPFARGMLAAGIGSCALAAWALWPVDARERSNARALRVCLVDVSASVTRTRPSWSSWIDTSLRTEARAAHEAEQTLLVVAYAAEIVRWFGPGAPLEFAERTRVEQPTSNHLNASDLGAALVGVERLASGFELEDIELRLFGDRTFTGSDPTLQLARWSQAGASVEHVEIPPPELADLAVSACRTPDELERGAPLSAVVTLANLGAPTSTTNARFEIEVTDDAGTRSLVRDVPVWSSPRDVRFDLGPVNDGWTRVRFRGALAGDPTPENDVVEANIRSRGALVVGCLGDPLAPDASREASVALRALDGISVLELDVHSFVERVSELDLLLTLDLDPRELPSGALTGFVARGGSWLACGGYGLLAGLEARGSSGAAAELPLEPDDDDPSARDVVLLVDASGSMAGQSSLEARRAAEELVRSARTNDALRLHFFTDELGEPIDLGRGGGDERERQLAARAVLAARAPGGATDAVNVLESVAAEPTRPERRRLIVLLSDGRDQPSDAALETRIERVLESLSARRSRLVTIAIGDDVDMNFLRRFDRAEWGATVVERGLDVREVLREELGRGRIREGPIAVGLSDASGAQRHAWAAEFADSLAAGGALPGLARSLRTRARDDAVTLLIDDEQRPLLALRRSGRGLVGCFASTPFSAWAPDWSARIERWAPLLRGMARIAARAREDSPHLRFEAPDRWIVEGAPADWPERVELDFPESLDGSRSAALEVDPHPAFRWGARRIAHTPGVEASFGGSLDVVVRGPSETPLATLAVRMPGEEEFRAPAPTFTPPAFGATAAHIGRGPRHSGLGRSMLALAVVLFALAAASGAVSGAVPSFAPRGSNDQGETLSSR